MKAGGVGGCCRSWAVMDHFAPRKPSASWSTTAASSTTMSAWPLCSWTALASGSLGAWTTCIQPRAMVGDLPARGSLSLSSMILRSWLMVVAEQSERNGGCLGGVHPSCPIREASYSLRTPGLAGTPSIPCCLAGEGTRVFRVEPTSCSQDPQGGRAG